MVVYQPQLETFKSSTVTGRAAVAVTRQGEAAPEFGVVFFSANVAVDREANVVSALGVKVERVRLPNRTEEQEKRFAALLEGEVPKWQLAISYDRFLENLKVTERERKSAEGLKHGPPRIIFANEPKVLVTIDGEPQLRDVEGGPFKVVVNTPFLIVFDARAGQFFLAGGTHWWYQAPDPRGPWQPIAAPPADLAAFAAARAQAGVGSGVQANGAQPANPAAADDGTGQARPPVIVVATEPTEIVVSEGKPTFKPLSGLDLLYMDNSESDVLMDLGSQDYYLLLAGRWYKSKSLAGGPWEYVAPQALPPSFAKIPPDSAIGNVLASVPGTDEAEDAVLDAQMPQTAAIKRSTTIEVTYDGAPKFVAVEGASTSYAVNASTAVLEIRGRYYACDNAVWYVADAPGGPWVVADSVPRDEIDQLPPSVPVYNVKYVTIYDSNTDVVYVGYTPGYVGWYPWYGTVIWGTGWYYPPWVGPVYTWEWPWTWGLCARWNPWTGWGMGISWDFPFIDVAFGWGGWFRPAGWGGRFGWGGWGGRRGGWFGPGGYRAPVGIVGRSWAHRPGFGPGAGPIRGVRPKVGFQPPAARLRSELSQRNLYNHLPAGSRVLPRQAPQPPRPAAGGRPNDVYGDRNGDVYRRTPGGQWQRHDGQRWQPAPQPPPSRPELDRDHGARQRGETRSRAGGGRPSGGHGGSHH